MRRLIFSFGILVFIPLLFSCSSHSGGTSKRVSDVDHDYVERVNRQAEGGAGNLEVHWINPPKKQKSSEDDNH